MNEDERLVLFGRLEATVDRLLKPGSAERLEILKAVVVGMELAAEVLEHRANQPARDEPLAGA